MPFWEQSKFFADAAKVLPPISAPLTSYYSFLNATKALLIVKGQTFTDRHGVSGDWDPASKRALSNEIITVRGSGIVTSLSKYLGEDNESVTFSLSDALGNLPFIHRAYRHTFKSKKELFFPLSKPLYRIHPADKYVWFSAEVPGRMGDVRVLKTLPNNFEIDNGFTTCAVIRSKKRIKWFSKNDNLEDKQRAVARLWAMHRRLRRDVSFISAPQDLWYLKRSVSGSESIQRSNLVLILASMHRLSELSRYDPAGLSSYLGSKVNWLLSEFIRLSPSQFIDEVACEITGLEMRLPGVRP